MDKALVLLTLEPTLEREALVELQKIEGVLEAHFLYGPYDAYALIEAENSGSLHTIVIDKIRNLDGINATMTCFVAD